MIQEPVSEADLPLPAKQYRAFITFWHLLMLGSLLAAVGIVLWNGRTGFGWEHGITILLILLQLGLYLKILANPHRWPPIGIRAYFAISLGLWLIEYWLAPYLFWIAFAYLGQMFGILPAIYGVGASIPIGVLVFWHSIDGDPGRLTAVGVLGGLAQWIGMTVFYLFLNYLLRTSQERGRLIAELKAAKAQLEEAQGREAELAVLRERERLARDLHDSLGHTLVALSVQLEAIQRLYRQDPERASDQVDIMKELTRSSMAALRRSLAGLRTPGLGDRSLGAAVEALCAEFAQRTGIAVECQVAETADSLGPALAEAVWRVSQEALANVEKHARARQVDLVLRREPGTFTLRVTDDGVGLPPGAESIPGRYGLRGIRERVEGLGGTVTLEDRSSGGTVIEARWPVFAGGEGEARVDHPTRPAG